MSILSSMRYCLGPATSHTTMWMALALMPFGLFFDFMDGKVARWRKKSSLMGQELDSLADLVNSTTPPLFFPILLRESPLHINSMEKRKRGDRDINGCFGLDEIDILRCRPRCLRFRPRPPHPARYPLPCLLRPLRSHASRSLQRYRFFPPQGRDGEIKVL